MILYDDGASFSDIRYLRGFRLADGILMRVRRVLFQCFFTHALDITQNYHRLAASPMHFRPPRSASPAEHHAVADTDGHIDTFA